MKVFIYIMSLVAVSVMVFNFTQINFENIFSQENFRYSVMILAGLSCLIVLRIMIINEKTKKVKKNN